MQDRDGTVNERSQGLRATRLSTSYLRGSGDEARTSHARRMHRGSPGARATLLPVATTLLLLGCESGQRHPPDRQVDSSAQTGADIAPAASEAGTGSPEPAPNGGTNVADGGVGTKGPRQRWAWYGFDLRNTQVNPNESVLNTGNVAGLTEKWRIRLPAGATSTPVAYDGMVYFGGWDGNAYAVDADTGEIHWQREITSLVARSTPLVTEDRVFIAAGGDLVGLNRADGTILFDTKLDPNPDTLIDSSPKLVDGLIVIGVSSIETGWAKDDYVSIGAVVALDAQTGEQVWRVPTTGDGNGPCRGGAGASVWSTAAIDEELGLVFIGTGQGHEAPASTCSDSLLAIHYARDYQGERVAWIAQYTQNDTYSAGNPFLQPDADLAGAPNLFEAGGQRLVGAGDKGASYRAFDRKTGEPKWRVDLDYGEGTGLGGVMVTAAVHDGVVYVASNHWTGLLNVSENLLTGTESADDYSTLYALDAATGKQRWQVKLSQPMFGSFAIANGLLYHATLYGMLYARELTAGTALWSANLDANIGGGVSVVDGRVYLSAGFGMGATTAVPGETEAFVLSFGLGEGPTTVWRAKVKESPPLTQAECAAALSNAPEWPSGSEPSPECSACLCQCDATAAGHCDTCWLPASCAAQSCWLFSEDDLRLCMSFACTTKLLPANVFEHAVNVAPCAIQCARQCGF